MSQPITQNRLVLYNPYRQRQQRNERIRKRDQQQQINERNQSTFDKAKRIYKQKKQKLRFQMLKQAYRRKQQKMMPSFTNKILKNMDQFQKIGKQDGIKKVFQQTKQNTKKKIQEGIDVIMQQVDDAKQHYQQFLQLGLQTPYIGGLLSFLKYSKARLLKWFLIDTFLNFLRFIPIFGNPVADILSTYLQQVAQGIDEGIPLKYTIFKHPMHWFPFYRIPSWLGLTQLFANMTSFGSSIQKWMHFQANKINQTIKQYGYTGLFTHWGQPLPSQKAFTNKQVNNLESIIPVLDEMRDKNNKIQQDAKKQCDILQAFSYVNASQQKLAAVENISSNKKKQYSQSLKQIYIDRTKQTPQLVRKISSYVSRAPTPIQLQYQVSQQFKFLTQKYGQYIPIQTRQNLAQTIVAHNLNIPRKQFTLIQNSAVSDFKSDIPLTDPKAITMKMQQLARKSKEVSKEVHKVYQKVLTNRMQYGRNKIPQKTEYKKTQQQSKISDKNYDQYNKIYPIASYPIKQRNTIRY